MEHPGNFSVPPANAGALGGPPPWLLPAGAADAASRARQEAERGNAQLIARQARAAVEHFRRAVSLVPSEPEYHFRLAIAADSAGQADLVEQHLLESIRLVPTYAPPRFVLATWYERVGRRDLAIQSAAAAAALSPKNPEYAYLRGNLLLAGGAPREAWAAIEPLVTAGSTDRWIADLYARLAPAIGHEERALEVVRRASRVPNLPPHPGGRPMLHFAAAWLLDRMGRYDEAFEQARVANGIVRTSTPRHDPFEHSEWVTRKIKYFSGRRIGALPRATHDNRRPVFIVGMPRSGTTLLEQILGCHPAIHPAGELQALRLIAKGSVGADWSEGAAYPECLDGLSLGRANRLAAQYVGAIDALDARATYVTDKQPLNFLLLDLVQLLFPNCHVIHCERNPLDTCLSNYMTNFAEPNRFKYDLGDLGAYYRDYRRLMEHWKKVLTVPMLEVRYEDVVLDTESQARRVLDFLGLPWDDRCMRYYENDRAVSTASRDQVRRPIYTTSVGRWKLYEKHLGELVRALGRSSGPTSRGPSGASAGQVIGSRQTTAGVS